MIPLDAIVIGGGLSGLALASELERRKQSYMILEARDRLGGRAFSRSMSSAAGIAHFDVGPAWFWPGQQRMARLAQNLHLGIFEQYAAGTLVFEDQFGDVRRDLDFSTMAGPCE